MFIAFVFFFYFDQLQKDVYSFYRFFYFDQLIFENVNLVFVFRRVFQSMVSAGIFVWKSFNAKCFLYNLQNSFKKFHILSLFPQINLLICN